MEDNDDISDDGKNLWSTLLQEVKEKSSKTRHIPNSILVLGNENCGKSSLIARLQNSDSRNGVGLEFEFIDVKDESMDENKQLNVWIASGDTFHSNLLKYAMDEQNFGLTLSLVMVSFSEPWAIMESLEQWLDILKKHIDRLKLEPRVLSNFKESLSRHFQEYAEPEVSAINTVVVGKRRDTDFNYLHPVANEDPEKIIVPLGESTFDKNLGIPIIVVITKTDQIPTLEQEYEYDDDKVDFIQINIRKLCLKYGAALCYTSLKDGRNCELLLRYLLHRCYGFPFIDTASVLDKDAIFIPAGWDNMNKINILAEGLPEHIRNEKFENLINKPVSLVRAAAQNRLSEPEMAEDEQVFLMKQQVNIQRVKAMANADPNAKPDSGRGSPLSKGSSMATSGPGRNRKNLPGQSSVGVSPANPGAQGNEGVLANFFSSLLNKRGVPGGPPGTNQQLPNSEPGKVAENLSETEDSLKEDLNADEMSMNPISNLGENLSPSKHSFIVVTSLEKLDEEVIEECDDLVDESEQNSEIKQETETVLDCVEQNIYETEHRVAGVVVNETNENKKENINATNVDIGEENEGESREMQSSLDDNVNLDDTQAREDNVEDFVSKGEEEKSHEEDINADGGQDGAVCPNGNEEEIVEEVKDVETKEDEPVESQSSPDDNVNLDDTHEREDNVEDFVSKGEEEKSHEDGNSVDGGQDDAVCPSENEEDIVEKVKDVETKEDEPVASQSSPDDNVNLDDTQAREDNVEDFVSKGEEEKSHEDNINADGGQDGAVCPSENEEDIVEKVKDVETKEDEPIEMSADKVKEHSDYNHDIPTEEILCKDNAELSSNADIPGEILVTSEESVVDENVEENIEQLSAADNVSPDNEIVDEMTLEIKSNTEEFDQESKGEVDVCNTDENEREASDKEVTEDDTSQILSKDIDDISCNVDLGEEHCVSSGELIDNVNYEKSAEVTEAVGEKNVTNNLGDEKDDIKIDTEIDAAFVCSDERSVGEDENRDSSEANINAVESEANNVEEKDASRIGMDSDISNETIVDDYSKSLDNLKEEA